VKAVVLAEPLGHLSGVEALSRYFTVPVLEDGARGNTG
jgi:hypothetical protein